MSWVEFGDLLGLNIVLIRLGEVKATDLAVVEL